MAIAKTNPGHYKKGLFRAFVIRHSIRNCGSLEGAWQFYSILTGETCSREFENSYSLALTIWTNK